MQIYQVDAFTEELFQGNPAAVVPLTEWLPDVLLQQIAMENNLAETAYIIPEGDHFQIRWFTPTVEVDLCGHATLAAGFVLFEYGGYKRDTILFRTRKAGDLEVSRASRGGAEARPGDASATGGSRAGGSRAGGGWTGGGWTGGGSKLTLNFPAGKLQEVDPAGQPSLFEGLGIPSRPLFRGPYDYLVIMDSQEAVEALRPDFRQLATVPARGVVVTAPGRESDFVSRCFFPQSGIDEDPVTGSAHTMLAPYWALRLGKTHLSAIQLSARRGYLDCELAGDRVYMSGGAKAYLKGEIFVGDAVVADSAEPADLSLRAAQGEVDHWIRTTGVRYFSELTNMAILTEEVGEVARLMSRLYGDQSFKETDKGKELSDELADVLWVLFCIANQTGVDLTDALAKNFTKKNIRDASRHRENEKLR